MSDSKVARNRRSENLRYAVIPGIRARETKLAFISAL
jgi:hypothetical protein